jgi:hypothetical protein
MMSQRTEALYRTHRPAPRPGGSSPSLADLSHAVEVAAQGHCHDLETPPPTGTGDAR